MISKSEQSVGQNKNKQNLAAWMEIMSGNKYVFDGISARKGLLMSSHFLQYP